MYFVTPGIFQDFVILLNFGYVLEGFAILPFEWDWQIFILFYSGYKPLLRFAYFVFSSLLKLTKLLRLATKLFLNFIFGDTKF